MKNPKYGVIFHEYAWIHENQTAILILCEMIIYILGLCHLGYLLNNQLLLVVIVNDDPLSNMNGIQLQLLKTATKVAVLQSIYTVSIIVYVIVTIICNILGSDGAYLLDWIVYFVIAIIGTICICLAFRINEKEYILLCKRCDSSFGALCHKAVNSKVIPQNMKRMALSYQSMIHDAKKQESHRTVDLQLTMNDDHEMEEIPSSPQIVAIEDHDENESNL